jgi:hypothetical protein
LATAHATVRPGRFPVRRNLSALAAITVLSGLGLFSPSGATTTTAATAGGSGRTPPASIEADCATDATAALNSWFASLPADTTVDLPPNGCYLVSNSPSSLLAIEHSQGLTINGNGTTLRQATYDNEGATAPGQVLTLGANSSLAINDLTVQGPGSTGGSGDESDAGILLWQNVGVALNAVTITSVKGDGLDVYPLGNKPGVNYNVSLTHSTIENVGYHAIVPEAADGFSVTNSTIAGGDIDAEVDFNCQPPKLPLADCGTLTEPAIGVVNMTFSGDRFPNGLRLEDGMSCLPVGNWTIEGNDLGRGGLDLQFDTTYSLKLAALAACGQNSGLTIAHNTSTGTTLTPCCGSGSPYILVQGWTNVTIADNHLVFAAQQGRAGGAVVDLWGDSNVAVTNNEVANYSRLTTSDAPTGWPATTNVTICGNTTGSPKSPTVGAPCAPSPAHQVTPTTGARGPSKDRRALAPAGHSPDRTPEVAAAIGLPLAALLLLGGAVLVIRRQRRLRPLRHRPGSYVVGSSRRGHRSH